jgi:hypothetical protein
VLRKCEEREALEKLETELLVKLYVWKQRSLKRNRGGRRSKCL